MPAQTFIDCHTHQLQAGYFALRLQHFSHQVWLSKAKPRKIQLTILVQFCTKIVRIYLRTNSGPNWKPNGLSPANMAAYAAGTFSGAPLTPSSM